MELHPFRALFPKLEKIKGKPSFFKEVKYTFNDFYAQDFFQTQPQEAFYLHQINSSDKSYTGIVGCIDIEDFIKGRIKAHENIIAEKERKQVNLLKLRSAIVKPILLTYEEVPSLNQWIAAFIDQMEPVFEFTVDGKENHSIWVVKHKKHLEEVGMLYKKNLVNTYIADGHHRTSASANLYRHHPNASLRNSYRWLPAALFSFEQLEVFDFNRVVKLSNRGKDKLSYLVDKVFYWNEMPGPGKPSMAHDLTMFWKSKWYRLKWKESIVKTAYSKTDQLDVGLLNENIVKPLLALDNKQLVEYIEGPEGLVGLAQKVNNLEHGVGFCLYPISMSEIKCIADDAEVLPPKSTWFEPRLKNGVLVKMVN